MTLTNPEYSSNPFKSAFQHIEHAAHVVEHAVVHDPAALISFVEKLNRILATGKTQYQIIKADYAAIETIIVKTTADGVQVATSEFTNVSADIALISDTKTLLAAIVRLGADVEAAYVEINTSAVGTVAGAYGIASAA
jgi:hypothetical protein